MLLSLRIAKRYLFGKKTTNAINIITGISVFGITLGTAALILILSVFNGFESLLSGIFDAFNPDLKVEPISGKHFQLSDDDLAQIKSLDGILHVSKTVEEIALFEYNKVQEIGVIKGVDEEFIDVTRIDTTLTPNTGKYLLRKGNIFYGIFSFDLASRLTLNTHDKINEVKVYMPLSKSILPGSREWKIKNIYPGAVYMLKNSDGYQYVLASYELVNNLLQSKNTNSYLEIKLKENADEESLRSAILNIMGDNFKIKNKYEQEETYLKIIKIEKWIAFLIVSLTMVLIIFNLIGSLWMIVLDKRKDFSILKALGYTSKDIRNIVLCEGFIICVLGIVLGIILALIIYQIQINMGVISVSDFFMMDAYPVKLKITDFILVAATVLSIGILASMIPAHRASKITAFVSEEH